MSEIQIAVLTGSFMLIGIISGALIEFQREKWRNTRELSIKKADNEKEDRKNVLSPLYYHIDRNFLNIAQYSDNIQTLSKKVSETWENNVTSIQALMKNNSYLLPKQLNRDIMLYMDSLIIFSKYFKDTEKTCSKFSEDVQNTYFEENKEKYLKTIDQWNEVTTKLSTGIYAFMTLGVYPQKASEEMNSDLRKAQMGDINIQAENQ